MSEFLFMLMGVCIGFDIRPVYVLLTGRDIPCYRDEPNERVRRDSAAPEREP